MSTSSLYFLAAPSEHSGPHLNSPVGQSSVKSIHGLTGVTYLLPKLHSVTVSSRRLHQGHLDPSPESPREGPYRTVLLTLTHKPCRVCAAQTENRLKLLAVSKIIPSTALRWLWACTRVSFVHPPVGQVTEAGKNHVRDGAEVETCLVAAELHEDQLFLPDIGRAAHHQGFLSERLEGQLFKRGRGICFFRETKKQEV